MLEKLPKKPEYIGGIKVAGAYKRFLKEEEEKAKSKREIKPEIVITPANINNFIYVPSINIHIAKQRTHLGKTWHQTHEALHQENLLMPTIPQFIAYINYLKQNPNGTQDASQSEIASILDDILTVRAPWRAEWLDADFKVVNNELHIHYNHRTIKDKLVPKNKELLTDYLTENKTPGINLDDWLQNANSHGLPKPNIAKGELYYWAPMKDNNSVARFRADFDWACLNCDGGPSDLSASLGVFGVCEANAAQRKI